MKILFLDDMSIRHFLFDEICPESWEVWHVYSAETAIKALESRYYDIAFLDHDLSDYHYEGVVDNSTGQEVAKFIAAMKDPPATVVIHSWNPEGAKAMKDILGEKTSTFLQPFSRDFLLDFLKNL